MRRTYLLLGAVLVLNQTAHTAEWQSKGQVGMESRLFEADSIDSTRDYGFTLVSRVESRVESQAWQGQLRVVGRADQADRNLTRFIVEEGWAGYLGENFELKVGAQIITWSATEAFHPADVINSRNIDANLENAEKIGEPMVSGAVRIGEGKLSAYFMPARMRPYLPPSTSRMSFLPAGLAQPGPLWVDADGKYSDAEFGAQGAVRFSQSYGGADSSLHLIRHQDRSQPSFAIDFINAEARPVYHFVTQAGATHTQILGSFTAKLEAAYRWFENPVDQTRFPTVFRRNHGQLALGVEKTIGFEGGSESTLIVEGQAFFGLSEAEAPFYGLFQRDGLVGVRHAFNDEAGREAFVSTIFDLQGRKEWLVNASYGQRLSDTWSIKTGVRGFFAPTGGGFGLRNLSQSDHVYVNVTRFF